VRNHASKKPSKLASPKKICPPWLNPCGIEVNPVSLCALPTLSAPSAETWQVFSSNRWKGSTIETWLSMLFLYFFREKTDQTIRIMGAKHQICSEMMGSCETGLPANEWIQINGMTIIKSLRDSFRLGRGALQQRFRLQAAAIFFKICPRALPSQIFDAVKNRRVFS